MEKSGAVHLGLCVWLSLLVAGAAVPFEPTASLPDVLTTLDGAPVTTVAQWGMRRTELKALLDETILGSKPKTRPALASHTVITKRAPPGGVAIERVGLKFAGVAGTVQIELLYRAGRAAIPAAAVLTQFDHRDWALRGVSRGFVGVVMPTGDTVDGTWPFYVAYNQSAPRPTWGLIARRAFLVSCIVDYLVTRADLIDLNRLHMFGHSRNGKQALIAAAYDDRLLSVAGSSPGFPIATPARFATNSFAGEQWPSSVTGAGSPCPDKHDGCSWWTSSAQQFYGQ